MQITVHAHFTLNMLLLHALWRNMFQACVSIIITFFFFFNSMTNWAISTLPGRYSNTVRAYTNSAFWQNHRVGMTGTEHKEHGFRKKKKEKKKGPYWQNNKFSPLHSLCSALISMAVSALYKTDWKREREKEGERERGPKGWQRVAVKHSNERHRFDLISILPQDVTDRQVSFI